MHLLDYLMFSYNISIISFFFNIGPLSMHLTNYILIRIYPATTPLADCDSLDQFFRRDVRVFANSPGDLDSIRGRLIPKTQKWYLIPPCLTLSIIRYGSRVKWSNPGKGAFESPSTTVTNFTYRCFEFIIFLLLAWLSYQGNEISLSFYLPVSGGE